MKVAFGFSELFTEDNLKPKIGMEHIELNANNIVCSNSSPFVTLLGKFNELKETELAKYNVEYRQLMYQCLYRVR